ncbi:MAG: lytic transglycosylase domain-containing protein [Desulfuromonadaceae bacterium]|nr:lytic transglycosylase domain-containing protein [Desulfuromonadaceae bacterium]MDD5107717.1 lytic transglycosylase domain-containing protein [Desulfuromonadaceae bacterium]
MSIPVEKLSLLWALEPLRQKSESGRPPHGSGFAETFDKALGGTDSPGFTAHEKARETAELLTLQMLQSSLALTGDASAEGAGQSPLTPSPTAVLLQAFRDNLAAGEKGLPSPQSIAPSQLQDMAHQSEPAAAPAAALSVRGIDSRADSFRLDPIISKASRTYGVDAGLIKAVIKAESNFNPQAVSHAGARGLMQLMPETARSLGVKDSFDPEQNVMGGTRFLKDLLQRYGGDVDAALAAYNWGPGNVDRRPDHLPRETRDYLVRVKQLYASYNS